MPIASVKSDDKTHLYAYNFSLRSTSTLTPENREEFFDEIAILETNNLNAILNGEK